MRIFAVDPGTAQSGWCEFEGGRVLASGVSPNEHLVTRIRTMSGYVGVGLVGPCQLAVERFEARGMPIGDDSIETVLWTGRFLQAWHPVENVVRVKRSEVKRFLCGTTAAKDPNVRQALLDLVGPRGTKRAPGPTFGVTSHAWAALGVAVTAAQFKRQAVAA